MQIKTKLIYLPTSPADGFRVLVERFWPHDLKREEAHIGLWFKLIAPTADLRNWFDHDPTKWVEFKQRYFIELDIKKDLIMNLLLDGQHPVITLLFSAHDEQYNSAVALKEYLEKMLH